MQVDFHMSHLSRLRNTNTDVACVCVCEYLTNIMTDMRELSGIFFNEHAFQEVLEDQNICCFCVSVSFVVIMIQCQLCCSV